MKVILESTPTLKGRVLEGKALTPAVSLNGNIYSAEEIDNAKNIGVPLKADWEHTDEIIGSVIFSADPSTHSLDYKITVESATRAAEIAQNPGMYKVSIEANVGDVVESCSRKRCYNLVSDISMEGIAVTKNPSVQTTSLKVVEAFQSWKPLSGKCSKCSGNKINEVDFGELARVNQELEEIKARIEKIEAFLTIPEKPMVVIPNESKICPKCGKHK